MTNAILAVVSAIVVFWLKRKLAREQNEKEQLKATLHKIDKMVADGNADSVNEFLDVNLRVQDSGRGNSGKQKNKKS